MKIKIMKPGATVTVDYEEGEAEEMFKNITLKMLGIDNKKKLEKVGGKIPSNLSVAKEPEVVPVQTAAEDTDISTLGRGDRHSGFLYIKCEHCGSERAYCQKTQSEYSICTKCGSRTYFTEPLRQILVNCECGQKSRYLTNMTCDMFDIQCINCGYPVAVKYNQNSKRYETIR